MAITKRFQISIQKLYQNIIKKKVETLLQNKSIIRNRLKINSAINNAKCFLEIQQEFGSFDKYLWAFVDFRSILNEYEKSSDLPASTEISTNLSKDLKKRGFTFVGPTICYALMQAVGMVNDHAVACFRYTECQQQN